MSENTELKPFPKGMAKQFEHPAQGFIIGGLCSLFVPRPIVIILSIVGYQLYKNVWLKKYKDTPKLENIYQYFLNMGIAATVVLLVMIVVAAIVVNG